MSIVDDVKAALGSLTEEARATVADWLSQKAQPWVDGELDSVVAHLRGTDEAPAETAEAVDPAGAAQVNPAPEPAATA